MSFPVIITDKFREKRNRPPSWPYRVNWDHPQARGLFMALPVFNQPRFKELTCFGMASMAPTEVNTNTQLTNWGIHPGGGRVYQPKAGGSDGYRGTLANGITAINAPMALMCWFRTSTLSSLDYILSVKDSGVGSHYYALGRNGDDPFCQTKAGGSTRPLQTTDNHLSTTETYHLAAVFPDTVASGDGNGHLIENGQQINERTNCRYPSTAMDTIDIANFNGGNEFGGDLWDLRVYHGRDLISSGSTDIMNQMLDCYERPYALYEPVGTKLFFIPSAPGGLTLNPTAVQLTLTVNNATVGLGRQADQSAANDLTLTRNNATVGLGRQLDPNAVTLGLTVNPATVTGGGLNLNPTAVQLTFTVSNSSVGLGRQLDSAAVNLSPTVNASSVGLGRQLDSAAVPITFTVSPSIVGLGRQADTAAVNLSPTVSNSSIGLGRQLDPNAVQLTLTVNGADVTLGSGKFLNTDAVQLTFTVNNADVDLGRQVDQTAANQLGLTVNNTTVGLGRQLDSTAVELALTVNTATVNSGLIITNAVELGLTVNNATVSLGRDMTATAVELAFTVNNATVQLERQLDPIAVVLGLTVNAASTGVGFALNPVAIQLSLATNKADVYLGVPTFVANVEDVFVAPRKSVVFVQPDQSLIWRM